ncbi:MAG: hypothetical protein H0W24_04080 [Lysobacter sp.]|nr:hypothetical protein [Lysobacter sp.]
MSLFRLLKPRRTESECRDVAPTRRDDAVARPEELTSAIAEALASGKPTIIDIAVDPDALIMPPSISVSQAMNFGYAKIREAFGA